MKALLDKYKAQLKTLQVTISNLESELDDPKYMSQQDRDHRCHKRELLKCEQLTLLKVSDDLEDWILHDNKTQFTGYV